MDNIFSRLLADTHVDTPVAVRVFCLNNMQYTIFEEPNRNIWFEGKGVVFVNKCHQADIVVASHYAGITPVRRLFLQFYHRKRLKFLLWNQEPRDNTFTVHKIRGKGIIPDLHVMNCYTGDVFFDNHQFCRWAMGPWGRVSKIDESTKLTSRKIVMMAKYVGDPTKNSLKIRGKEVDLSWLRCHIAFEGHKRGLVDIYGTGWPADVRIEDSRAGDDWMQRKLNVLRDYPFNLCFENTMAPFYCSEKIWNAITAGCLPIYYGAGTRIYDDFPRNSFLDYSELGSPAALFEKVLKMSEEEYRERFNLCVQTYNRIFDSNIMNDNDIPVKSTTYRLHTM